MKFRAFFFPAVITAAFAACTITGEHTDSTESNVSGVPIGEVRGVADISKSLRARVFDPADAQTASFDVSRVAGAIFTLRKQLGTFATEGTTSTYQGGQPTPLRATLWHQVAGQFASTMADLCTQPGTKVKFPNYQPDFGGGPGGPGGGPFFDAGFSEAGVFRVRPAFAQTVSAVCRYEGDEAAHKQAAGALFDSMMGIGGSLAEEKVAFQNRFASNGSAAAAAPAKERVTNMMIALFLNPHFLLAK
jgi:hypothetical protein